MNNKQISVYLCVAAFLVAGCDGLELTEPPSEDRYIEVPAEGLWVDKSQCGSTLDFQDVAQYDGTYGVTIGFVNTHQGPVGYHVEPGCSGTLVSKDVFLSAGHCGYRVGDTVRFGFQLDRDGNTQPGEYYSVVDVIEQEDSATLDYAVVRLAGIPGSIYGFARMADREPQIDELITIIGHPARWPKKVSTGRRVALASAIGAHWFRHQADTLGGSSGSGVIGSDGALVGVHTNAGCSTSSNVKGNHAIRMSVLLDNSPVLSELFHGGFDDLCSAKGTSQGLYSYCFQGNGTGQFGGRITDTVDTGNWSDWPVFYANINGDKVDDLCSAKGDSSSLRSYCYMGDGTGQFGGRITDTVDTSNWSGWPVYYNEVVRL